MFAVGSAMTIAGAMEQGDGGEAPISCRLDPAERRYWIRDRRGRLNASSRVRRFLPNLSALNRQ
jgi:hypothetical protein